ncbi:hypothetical protein Hanom_Chr02g00117271 [Helianthus anomalus]
MVGCLHPRNSNLNWSAVRSENLFKPFLQQCAELLLKASISRSFCRKVSNLRSSSSLVGYSLPHSSFHAKNSSLSLSIATFAGPYPFKKSKRLEISRRLIIPLYN